MTDWNEVERDAPDFARRVRAAFDAGTKQGARVALISLNEAGDRLVIESWHSGRGYRRLERE